MQQLFHVEWPSCPALKHQNHSLHSAGTRALRQEVKQNARCSEKAPFDHRTAATHADTTHSVTAIWEYIIRHSNEAKTYKIQAAVVEGDLPRSSLKRGVEAVLARHPMLRACIRTPDGPKEPLINILGEEREDGDPLYFCESPCESLGELAERVLAPEEAEVADEDAFTREWRARLESNLDNARLPVSAGPNWRVETIRLAGGGAAARGQEAGGAHGPRVHHEPRA